MTTTRRAAIASTLVVGTILLGWSLATAPGDGLFYPLLLAVALTWSAGGVIAGGLTAGRTGRRDVASALLVGAVLGGAFVAAGALVRLIPALRHPVLDLFAHADRGNAWVVALLALLNGVAEEVFFRGAVFAAVRRRPVLASSLIYLLVTLATANPMLTLAAVVVGPIFGWQRVRAGGVLAPALTHVAWTATVLVGLPIAVGAAH